MKTVFIRAIEAEVGDKPAAVLAAARGPNPARFDIDVAALTQVPQSPFAYWAGEGLRAIFAKPRAYAFDAKCGMGTLDDFRFLRLSWEVSRTSRPEFWPPFAKGGAFGPFYSDIHLNVDWAFNGSELKTFVEAKVGSASRKIQATSYYFRPGLTWPLRTNGLSFRVMPTNCIFSHKGPAAFVEENDPPALLALCAVLNSGAFGALVAVQLARTELAQSYEVGLIQQTPVPVLSAEDTKQLLVRALRSWSLKRRLDTRTKNAHAFLLPSLLQVQGGALIDRARSWGQVTEAVQAELDALAAEIDDHAYRLYGISAEDRQRIEQGFGASGVAEDGPGADDAEETDEDPAEVDPAPMVASLLSWAVGVSFGRFDVRLATGERAAPPEPEPFDPLPVCSPGMLSGDDGLPPDLPPEGYPVGFPADGLLVDDPGHPRDLVGAVRSVFDLVFDDANARWHEAAALLGTPDLRGWFARDFFEPHIKRYSKSRRKAPIYWQLATASGSYSVWVYIHRATGDTLFRVLNDFVGPKLDHEKAQLARIIEEAGATPSAAQRRAIERQEIFVGELQALKTEVARVAPLWRPNLDDGVILNFAPLWRLVPQSRSWQTECKKAWDKLAASDYDWAHVAMHLWPERVVPKCRDDRSLAIAHGLEDVFWHEDESGTWCKRPVDEATVEELIAERSSAAVAASLEDLLSAPASSAAKGRAPRRGGAGPRKAASRVPAPAPAPRPSTPAALVDGATLAAVTAAIATRADGASKAEVLAATGLPEADWSRTIAVLLERGGVVRTGQKRGTRYYANGGRG